MAGTLTFHYDQTGDILYIDRCTPYAEQESEAIGDDIVVRIRADGAGSRIDIRSKSRDGDSDLGVNARRIREFIARLKAAG